MTQVVNGYLAWSFQDFEVQVIRSRDGSKGVRALVQFVRALFQVSTVRRQSRSIFVVHLSQGGSFVREGLLLMLASARGFGTIAHLHGSRFVSFTSRARWLVKRVLGSASKVIVLSEATANVVRHLVPRDRVALVPNAVPSGRPCIKERLVVFGGGVCRRKGVDVLVAAWRELEALDGWTLEIAGPIIERDILPRHLERVVSHGAIPHEALMSLLDRSAIAVLPSRDEAMPMFILEALARENCVISTCVGGIPRVLSEGCGILVDAGDKTQLINALRVAMNHDELRQRVAHAGRVRFEKEFSAAAVYPQVERLWAEVLQINCSN